MAEARPMIEFRDVSIRLNGRDILENMSFQVKRGEVFVVIGYSGTGKSVTLQNMTGLLIPDRGTIHVDGQQIVGMEESELEETRRKFGYLFQSGALINWLSVAENVELPLREHTSLSKKGRMEIVRDKLKLVNMEEDGDKYPDQISGGMKKRAALARAIALEPEIVLFDEPTSGLDPVISRQIDELIKAINRVMGITCIVVTHDMESAYGIANRIAFFYKGAVHFVGTPREFRLTPDEAVRHFVTGGKEGRLTQKSMTAIIRSEPLSQKDETPSDAEAEPISANVEAKLRKTVRETRRLTKEELKHRRSDKGRSSQLKAVNEAAKGVNKQAKAAEDVAKKELEAEIAKELKSDEKSDQPAPAKPAATQKEGVEDKSAKSESNTVMLEPGEMTNRKSTSVKDTAASLEAESLSNRAKKLEQSSKSPDAESSAEATKETPS